MKEKIKGKLFFFTREVSSPLFLLEWESPVAHSFTRNRTHGSDFSPFSSLA